MSFGKAGGSGAKAVVDEKAVEAAVKIQKVARGGLSRERFGRWPSSGLVFSRGVFAIGNEPVALEYKSDNKLASYAIVATSGLKVLDLVGQISKDRTFVPKIYLVDSSTTVHKFWRNIQTAFSHCKNLDEAMDKLEEKLLAMGLNPDDMPEIEDFLETVAAIHGFETLQKVIANVALIEGNWSDVGRMKHLREIIKALGIEDIVAYPSNIMSCVGDSVCSDVIKGLQALEPRATILTNLDPDLDQPSEAFTIEGAIEEAAVRKMLGLPEVHEEDMAARVKDEAKAWAVAVMNMSNDMFEGPDNWRPSTYESYSYNFGFDAGLD